MLSALTDPLVVSRMLLASTWSVAALLATIAELSPPAHALIDAGALITGLSNVEVAAQLLPRLGPQFEGVVYLLEGGRKRILLRSGATMELERCGLPKERRFTFFDQIHCTDMDISQVPNAEAVATLGKGMTQRDHAQACYRMRGFSKGQKITIIMVPEIKKQIDDCTRNFPFRGWREEEAVAECDGMAHQWPGPE